MSWRQEHEYLVFSYFGDNCLFLLKMVFAKPEAIMKLKLLKSKAKTPEGHCRVIGCNESAACYWRKLAVCSKHWFEFRDIDRAKRKLKKEVIENE